MRGEEGLVSNLRSIGGFLIQYVNQFGNYLNCHLGVFLSVLHAIWVRAR